MLLTVLGDTVPSYRRSQFLPGIAAAAVMSSLVSRPVGRGIDEVEREDLPMAPVDEVGGESLLSPTALMDSPSRGAGAEPLPLIFPFNRDPVEPLREVEDRRVFHPERGQLTASRTVRGSQSRLDASSLPQMASRVRYSVASRSVITCIRRKIRREVILAKGHGGANVYVPPLSMEVCE